METAFSTAHAGRDWMSLPGWVFSLTPVEDLLGLEHLVWSGV